MEIADVGAAGRLDTVGDPEQAKEAHDMIDAQGAGVPRVVTNGFGEQPVAVLAVAFGVGRREPPILPLGGEAVRGRSHAAAGHEERAVRPQVGTAAIRRQRQIVIQADGQAFLDRVALGSAQLLVQLPLRVLVQKHGRALFLLETARRLRLGIAVLRGPVGPDPDFGMLFVDPLVERAVSSVAVE